MTKKEIANCNYFLLFYSKNNLFFKSRKKESLLLFLDPHHPFNYIIRQYSLEGASCTDGSMAHKSLFEHKKSNYFH